MERPPQKKLITNIDVDMWERAQRRAVQEDRSAASLVRKALRLYLEEHDDEQV